MNVEIQVALLLRQLRVADVAESIEDSDPGRSRPWRIRSIRHWKAGAVSEQGFSRTEELIAGGEEHGGGDLVATVFITNEQRGDYIVTRIDLVDDVPWRLARVVQRVVDESIPKAAV